MSPERRRAGSRTGGSCLRRIAVAWALAVTIGLVAVIGPAAWIYFRTEGKRFEDVNRVPAAEAALVFGAGLQPDGTPTPLLSDRIHAAVLLYQAGKVQRLLLSGDGLVPGHDEPASMARQAEREGVPASVLIQDPGGVHTADSCERAHDRFGMHSVIVVSQSYHLPRAIFACERAGLHTNGFSLALTPYGSDPMLRAREVLSLDAAWVKSLF